MPRSPHTLPVVSLAGGVAVALLLTSGRPLVAQDTARALSDERATAASLEGAFMRIADALGPATVSIEAQVDAPRRRSPLDDDDDPSSPAPSRPTATSVGSGVIVRADGYILTNDHVIEGARDQKVTVKLADGTTYTGAVIRDRRSDLALVKIQAPKPLPFVRFADSDQVRVGQWAIAIGSPFGKENTMTTGIVSALHRKSDISDGRTGRYYPSLIQTDAAINRGNSGGPLLNIRGELVGINVAIFSPTGTSAGIGFAIPSNTARRVLDQLVTRGRVVRGSLGVVPEDIPADLRTALHAEQGAYIRQVTVNGPADRAGLDAGDVVVQYNGKPVPDENALREAIGATAPGSKATLGILRNAKPMTLSATLSELKGDPNPPATTTTPPASRLDLIGIRAQSLTPEYRNRLSLPDEITGLVVVGVAPGSIAENAGLRRGTVLTAVNGKRLTTPEALQEALQAGKPGDIVSLQTLHAVIDLGSEEPSLSRGIAPLRLP